MLFPLLQGFVDDVHIFCLDFKVTVTKCTVLLILVVNNRAILKTLTIPNFLVFTTFNVLAILAAMFLTGAMSCKRVGGRHHSRDIVFSVRAFIIGLTSKITILVTTVYLSLYGLGRSADTTIITHTTSSSILKLQLAVTKVPVVNLLVTMLMFQGGCVLARGGLRRVGTTVGGRRGYWGGK